MELLKAHLAAIKLHIPTKVLERGIVMPRDMDGATAGYPNLVDTLQIDPWPVDKNAKKKKEKESKKTKGKSKEKTGITQAPTHKLELTKKQEYRVFEFGNYPEVTVKTENAYLKKPRGGCFRLLLPADADWSRPTKGGDDKDKDKKQEDDVINSLKTKKKKK